MKKCILLGVTASIAAYKACDIITRLKREGLDVIVCATKDALEFITPLTLQTLSCNKVFCDMFEPVIDYNPWHVSWAKRADLFLIAPATADCISKIAAGICDDILTCTVVSTKAPFLIAPAMNENMYKNKIIQANIKKLQQMGFKFIGPKKGRLACGDEGIGHIADVAEIVKEAKKALK
jgi:phosphopantothenoylcysteine decarboxylase / phosphopantothenate---cysteine ligase